MYINHLSPTRHAVPARAAWARFGLAVLLAGTFPSPAAHAFVHPGTTRFAVKVQPELLSNQTSIGKIERSMLDSTVELQGTIQSITPPREGSRQPYRVNISDETGSINVIIWQDTYEVVKSQHDLAPGDLIRIRAPVTEFRGELQVTVKNAGDISIRPQAAPPVADMPASEPKPTRSAPATSSTTTRLADIGSANMGQDVTVEATITDVREPRSERAPFIVTLTQGSANVPMVFWSDLHASIAGKIRVGNTVRVKAQVSEYRGTTQLKLRNAGDIHFVGAGGSSDATIGESDRSPRAASGPAGIGGITEAMANSTVTIAGRITSSDSIGKGQRLRVRDDSGEIQVILWDNVLSRLSAADLVTGRSITVTGRVKLYRGSVEVVPDSAEGVDLRGN